MGYVMYAPKTPPVSIARLSSAGMPLAVREVTTVGPRLTPAARPSGLGRRTGLLRQGSLLSVRVDQRSGAPRLPAHRRREGGGAGSPRSDGDTGRLHDGMIEMTRTRWGSASPTSISPRSRTAST